MFFKKTFFFLFIFLFYQTVLHSKSISFDPKDLSNYFSGIVAYENKDNSLALDFFNSSKTLIKTHDPYFKKYVNSLFLENKISQAINLINYNKTKKNPNFFEARLLLVIDNIKKKNLNLLKNQIKELSKFSQQDELNSAITETLKQFIFIFNNKKILSEKKKYGNLTLIAETFQRCYLGDPKTEIFFSNLINNYDKIDYTRYLYFFLSYLIENERYKKANEAVKNVEYLNSTLLLSQGKNWIENNDFDKFSKIFSCKNYNDIVGEFFFLISNLYSSQGNYEKSNFYLNISYFLNPKFTFNLALGVENYYDNKDYKKVKKILKFLNKEDKFYYWYRIKKEAQIIELQNNKKDSLNYIVAKFKKFEPNKNLLILQIFIN